MTTKSESIRVYARALFDLALASGSVDATGTGLASMQDAVAANPTLSDALADVSLPSTKKAAILQELFVGVAPEALGIALISIERIGAQSLGLLVAAFDEIAANERNIVVAEVTTAHPLTDSLRASLQEKLSANIGKPVTLRERTDEKLIGGVRINIAGRVLDGSISKQLTSIRSALTNSSVGGEA